MKILSTKYPLDIIFCLFWSILLLPIAFLSIDTIIRTILGLPYLLFIPGYLLLSVLFPTKKTEKGITTLERIAFSVGISLALVPLLGFILNYTILGIRLESILLSIFFLIILFGILALYRWKKTPEDQRFIPSIELTFPKSQNKLHTTLIILLVIAILLAFGTFLYLIITPRTGEAFTEFYLLGPTGQTTNYPNNLTVGENASIIIGLVNHEYKPMNYTIEIWLINQTTVYNESTHTNETRYTHMWFMEKISVMLNYSAIYDETEWIPQWEHNYTFQIQRKGEYILSFLLFTAPTEDYSYYEDYKDFAEQQITKAYERTYLQLNVT